MVSSITIKTAPKDRRYGKEKLCVWIFRLDFQIRYKTKRKFLQASFHVALWHECHLPSVLNLQSAAGLFLNFAVQEESPQTFLFFSPVKRSKLKSLNF